MIIGTLMVLETCLILGQVSHNLLYSMKKLLTDILGPGEINEKAAYIQARSSMARVVEVNGKERQAEGKAKNGLKKRFTLTMHENCVESNFIDPEDKEFKETIKNAREKLETSVAPAMPLQNYEELWEWRI